MSYGEGDLHARVGELEYELSEAQGVVEDFACENVELRERVEELESLVRDMHAVVGVHERHWRDDGEFTAHENFERRMAALGIAEGDGYDHD